MTEDETNNLLRKLICQVNDCAITLKEINDQLKGEEVR